MKRDIVPDFAAAPTPNLEQGKRIDEANQIWDAGSNAQPDAENAQHPLGEYSSERRMSNSSNRSNLCDLGERVFGGHQHCSFYADTTRGKEGKGEHQAVSKVKQWNEIRK